MNEETILYFPTYNNHILLLRYFKIIVNYFNPVLGDTGVPVNKFLSNAKSSNCKGLSYRTESNVLYWHITSELPLGCVIIDHKKEFDFDMEQKAMGF